LSQPAVSVITSAYNAQAWIGETLDSVLAQTYTRLEVIVVDDGSTDATPAIVESGAPRVRCMRQKRAGSAVAINAGIRASTAPVLAFVDHDDLWVPDKIERQLEALAADARLGMVYSDATVFEGERDLYCCGQVSRLHSGEVLRQLLLEDFIPSPTPLVRREVLERVGGFDESIWIANDWDMWLRIASKYPVGLVDRPLARYRVHALSTSSTMDLRLAHETMSGIVERAVDRDPERLGDLREQALANICLRLGQSMLKRHVRCGARTLLARGLRLRPTDARLGTSWLATFLPERALAWAIDLRRISRLARMRCPW